MRREYILFEIKLNDGRALESEVEVSAHDTNEDIRTRALEAAGVDKANVVSVTPYESHTTDTHTSHRRIEFN